MTSSRLLWFSTLVLVLFNDDKTEVSAHWPHDNIEGLSVNEDAVFASNRGYLVYSSDGGRTFQEQRRRRAGMYSESIAVSSTFANDNTLYMYNAANRFCVSTDGGVNFRCLFDGCAKTLPHDGNAEFVASSSGYAITVDKRFKLRRSSGREEIVKSNTASPTFSETINLGFTLTDCPAIAADKDGVMYLGTTDGDLYQSYDYGATWTFRLKTTTPVRIRRVAPIDENMIFLLCDNDLIYYQGPCGGMRVVTLPPVDNRHTVMVGEPTPVIMISAHRYQGKTTLFVTRDNVYSMWYTRNLGATWQIRSRSGGGRSGPAFFNYCCKDAFINGDKEITQIIAMPNSPRVWAATYTGVYRSDDDGLTWEMIDTVNNVISGISVASLSPTEWRVGLSTLMGGSYGGTIVRTGTSIESAEFNRLRRGDIHKSWFEPFWLYAVSPNYKDDNTSYRFGKHRPGTYRFERSTDDFKNDITLIDLPLLDPSDETFHVQQITFSKSGRVFVCGWNLGIVSSKDGGNTWSTFWNPMWSVFLPLGEVLEVRLSPSFDSDGIVAALVLTEGGGTKVPRTDKGTKDVYLKNTVKPGAWRKLKLPEKIEYSSMAMMAGRTAPILVLAEYAAQGQTMLFAVKVDKPLTFRMLSEIDRSGSRPLGYSSRQAVIASPDGSYLAAAYREGSMLIGSINKSTLVFDNFEFANPQPKFIDDSLNFGCQYNRNEHEFAHLDVVAYSPNFAEDGVIFAREFYTLYISFDRGLNWEAAYTLPQNQHLPEGFTADTR